MRLPKSRHWRRGIGVSGVKGTVCRATRYPLMVVDSRTTSLHGRHNFLAVPAYRFSMRSSRNFAAADPCCAIGCSTVVSGGVVKAANGILSKSGDGNILWHT
jgi:hypothetical protein